MRTRFLPWFVALVAVCTINARAADSITLDLWPGSPPGDAGKKIEAEKATKGRNSDVVTSLTNVSIPTLKVYRPSAETANGVAVVVCPGGGYTNLAWDHEGEQVARWLNSIGVTAAILKYRVPRREGTPNGQPPVQALMDAQRALSLVRGKASEWGVDAKRIGMLGFSAGGHLTTWAATNFDKRAYEAVDDSDKASCRPDFAVMIYPGGVLKRGTQDLTPEIRVTSETPPSFFVHAADDHPESSIRTFLAIRAAGVPAEMHIYSSGGHGFGMRPSGKPAASWPNRCEEWMREQGILKAKAEK